MMKYFSNNNFLENSVGNFRNLRLETWYNELIHNYEKRIKVAIKISYILNKLCGLSCTIIYQLIVLLNWQIIGYRL